MNYDLPVAFYFQVTIDKVDTPLLFKEVTGLSAEMELEKVQEGGLNNYEHQLPKQIKHNNLVLKRALNYVEDKDVMWIKHILQGDLTQSIIPRNIHIQLLNAERNPIYTWLCVKAYPVKWDVEPLDAEKNSVLIESIEFTYTTLMRWQLQLKKS